MQANLLQPNKRLHFTEDHFQGFWVQLLTLIRRNEHADAYLDGILSNPMRGVSDANADNANAEHPYTLAIQALYVAGNLGDPVGTFPDYAQLEDDPIGAIRDFAIATNSGQNGGLNPGTGRPWVASRNWARRIHDRNMIFRQACKHIWETVVATFSTAEAATMIAGLPYGSGPKLLTRVKRTQQRQTTMALVTLFINLITMRLKPKEKIAGLYGRILEIKARLENWDPPIFLPNKLFMVCMIRLLPRMFHQTRVIIMTQKSISLEESKDMLLDVENKDAERVAAAVGSTGASAPSGSQKVATALVTNTHTSKRKKKKKKRSPAKSDSRKSAKYHSEGPCPHHGAKCGHAGSECYVLHPELKPMGAIADEAEALAVSDTVPKDNNANSTPYGFLNEGAYGYALTASGEEVNSADDTLWACMHMLRRGAHGVGKHKRYSWLRCLPVLSHSALRPDTDGKPLADQPKGSAVIAIEQVANNERCDGLNCYPGGVQLGANVYATTDVPCLLMTESSCENACRPMSTGTLSTIVVKRAIAGRDLSLKDVRESRIDVRSECPVSPLTRTEAHSARTVPQCETHNMTSITNLARDIILVHQMKLPKSYERKPLHDYYQNMSFTLMKWLITIAQVPHWEVMSTISNMDEVADLLQLPNALRWGVRDNSWHWAKQLCRHLSVESSMCLYCRLLQEYTDAYAHQLHGPKGQVWAHISKSNGLGVSIVTTAAMKQLEYREDQLTPDPRSQDCVKVDNLILTPKCNQGDQERLKLSNIWLRVVDSELPMVCIANFDAAAYNEYFGTDKPSTRVGNTRDSTTGYAYMFNSESSDASAATVPRTKICSHHETMTIDPSESSSSTYEQFAINTYNAWAARNPQRARLMQRIRDGSLHDQQKWDEAEEVLEALLPANYGPAPPKFSAAKGLQKLMQHERERKDGKLQRQTGTHTAAVCASAPARTKKASAPTRTKKGSHLTSTKGKNHPRSKKSRRRPKNNHWSKKPKRKSAPPPAEHNYENVVHGDVLCGKQVPIHATPVQRRLARTGGVRDLRAERVKKLQRPTPVTFDLTGDMIGVKTKYAFAPGLTTTMTHREGCPRAAIGAPSPPSTLPVHVSVPVPGRFTIVLRVGHSPIPGHDCLTIPGTALVLQVERVETTSHALVTAAGDEASSTVLDSGATEHISPRVTGPLSAAPITAIHGLSGKGTPVTGMGTVNQVENVMCCPGSSRRLLSVARLLEQLGGRIVFTQTKAFHVNNDVATPIATRNGKGLYRVTTKDFDLETANTQSASALVGNSISTDLARERITALHRTFGHASKEVLRAVIKQHKFAGVQENHLQLLQPCNACMLGKSSRMNKGRLAAEKATTFGYRLCSDCCGPFRTRSVGGARYLLVVVDEFSSWTWVAPLYGLAQVHEHIEHIIEVRLHQRDDTTVTIFRSDGGKEFCNRKVDTILLRHGIERETTCPNTSYQNGKAERRIRTIFERVRTCLSDAGLPSGFWAEAAVYAAYTLNRTPAARGTSPFFKRYGRHPKVSHMRPFGNPCVIYRDRSIAGKIEDAGIPGTFLGYGYVNGKKGTRVRINNTNKVTTVKDVVCGVFPSGSARVQLLQPDMTVAATTPTATTVKPTATADGEQVATALEENTTPDATITTLDNEQEVEASLRANTMQDITPEVHAPRGNTHDIFTVGAKVEGNWRGHGKFYDATVTAVHKAGRRVTYDLIYDDDNEAEPNIGAQMVRTRHALARSTSTGLCAHALVTDCNPAYIAAVPDMARAHITPKHYGEAMHSKDKVHWLKAIFDELKSVKDQGVFEFVAELPDGVKALTSVWVFKVKCGPDGTISRYKARITVNGKSQVYGINYSETFSPVAFATTIRLLLAIALTSQLQLRQYDIKGAFLYADLPEEERVYMRAPPGYGRKGYWYLLKTLYGLRQSPRRFNEHLNGTLTKLGWESCTFDPCLYRHVKSGAYLVVVVDDMILASPSATFTKSFYASMSAVYDIKDLGEPKYVIGVRIDTCKDSLKLLQDRYITDLHEKHKGNTRATATPAIANLSLCMSGIKGQDKSPLLPVPKVYRSLVGGLMYTLITRPDVAAAVSVCARYLAQPRQAHMNAALRVLSYLYQTRHMALTYHASDMAHLRITVYADSSWADDADTRRSRYGYALYVGRCLVSWRSKLHSCIALSTAEAEYCAATEAAKHIKWVASLIRFMLPKLDMPPALLYEDNAACRAMVTSAQISGRNKHFELKQHFIRELYHAKVFKLMAVGTQQQIADIFTKALARPTYEIHRKSLLEGITLDLIEGASTEGGS